MLRPTRATVFAVAIVFALQQTAWAARPNGPDQQDNAPFWVWALAAVAIVLLTRHRTSAGSPEFHLHV
jgi:hypothetical protein